MTYIYMRTVISDKIWQFLVRVESSRTSTGRMWPIYQERINSRGETVTVACCKLTVGAGAGLDRARGGWIKGFKGQESSGVGWWLARHMSPWTAALQWRREGDERRGPCARKGQRKRFIAWLSSLLTGQVLWTWAKHRPRVAHRPFAGKVSEKG
jgi:hypothetical protein